MHHMLHMKQCTASYTGVDIHPTATNSVGSSPFKREVQLSVFIWEYVLFTFGTSQASSCYCTVWAWCNVQKAAAEECPTATWNNAWLSPYKSPSIHIKHTVCDTTWREGTTSLRQSLSQITLQDLLGRMKHIKVCLRDSEVCWNKLDEGVIAQNISHHDLVCQNVKLLWKAAISSWKSTKALTVSSFWSWLLLQCKSLDCVEARGINCSFLLVNCASCDALSCTLNTKQAYHAPKGWSLPMFLLGVVIASANDGLWIHR